MLFTRFKRFKRFKQFKQYNLPLVLLALPILGTYLALTGIEVVDTIMAGQLSSTDLAGIAIGSSVFRPSIMLVFGTLMATTTLVAQAKGSGCTENLSSIVHQASWVAVIILLPVGLILFYSHFIFNFMGVGEEIASLATNYLRALIWGLPALAFFQVLRCTCEGLNHATPILIISLAGLLLNIPANYVLIYGKLGFPQLGAVGCGYATSISFWFMALILSLYVHYHRRYRNFAIFAKLQSPRWREIWHILWVGLPIGLAIFIEVSLFTTITLFIGGLGEITVAGHQIAINFTSLIFMVPLSLGVALTVKVGHAVGSGQAEEARRIAFYGISFALLVAVITGNFMWFSASAVAAIYSGDVEVQLLATALIQLAILYQISDAIQVNAAAALRGYKDTRIIMLITIFSYWIVGLGSGWWLAQGPMGTAYVHGFWYGMILGLSSAAILLLWRLNHTSSIKHPHNLKLGPNTQKSRPVILISKFKELYYMPRMVKCVKLGQELAGLARQPYPGELGKRIFEQASQEAWNQWLRQQTILINEYRLSPVDPQARQMLEQAMEKFFFEPDQEQALPTQFIPPKA